jgi:squalene-hopene/tetraprenyl-beta-curcumene cyclase
MLDLDRLNAAYERAKAELLAERTPDGHWVGELSSSALSTATAVSALSMVRGREIPLPPGEGGRRPGEGLVGRADELDSLIERGIAWLVRHQNDDGGFGDTDLSHSNIATTYLVVAALHLAGRTEEHAAILARANAYLDAKGRLAGLRKRYGIDKTFVVPIMTNLAIAGLLDWREIDPLPFELATVPQSWYRFVGMPVVSYAIPALVAIGQAQYFHAPPWNPFTRFTRWLSITRSLRVLRRMQPDSGGYLEATPLTSFVVMSLASLSKPRPVVGVRRESIAHSASAVTEGRPPDMAASAEDSPRPLVGAMHPVADDVIRHGVQFLIDSVRPDGSWPIDTNLATWNTTLAINALAGAGEDVAELLGPKCLDWLLSCQHTKRHPFTGADPGGFGWSDLSGAVPDADDTPGALLALDDTLDETCADNVLQRVQHLEAGVRWLLSLQNADGGWPTFCRGWGRLPFDRSGPDLTAHAIRAIHVRDLSYFANKSSLDPALRDRAMERAVRYLRATQSPDGSWSPLWFGNQDHPEEDNPVYGTAKVLRAYSDLMMDIQLPEVERGIAWLVANQNVDGGWGSGVWSRLRIADCGLRIEERETGSRVEREEEVTGPVANSHSVPGTQYSVLSTEQPAAVPPQSAIHSLQSSVEETALAVEALVSAYPLYPLLADDDGPMPPLHPTVVPAVARGLAWLIERVEAGQHRQPAPIGFYFAKLWYYEKLYPLTFTVAALGLARLQFARPQLDSAADPAASRAP